MTPICCYVALCRLVRWERTVGRSVGDRPQVGGMAQRGFVGIRGGLPVARPMAHNEQILLLNKGILIN
jgi:hypothetical protein